MDTHTGRNNFYTKEAIILKDEPGHTYLKFAFSNLACPEWSIEEVMTKAAKYGYQGVELRLLDGDIIRHDIDAHVRRTITQLSRANEVEIIGIGASTRFTMDDDVERRRNLEELLQYLELAADMEVPMVRTFGGMNSRPPDRDTERVYVNRVAESLNLVAPRAEELGVNVLLETHDEFSSSYLVRDVMQQLSSPNVAVIWDIHHTYRMGETTNETLRNLSSKIKHVHIKDAIRTGNDDWKLVLLGDGEIPVSDIVSTLKDVGYKGYLSVEWERKWHPEIESADIALPKHISLLKQYVNGVSNSVNE